MGSELGPLVGCLELGNKIPGYKKWGGGKFLEQLCGY